MYCGMPKSFGICRSYIASSQRIESKSCKSMLHVDCFDFFAGKASGMSVWIMALTCVQRRLKITDRAGLLMLSGDDFPVKFYIQF